MPGSGTYLNFSAVSFTPSGGTATPINGVKSIAFDENGESVSDGADFDLFDTVNVITALRPRITIETRNAMLGMATLAAGTVGALTYTVRDTRNGATALGGAQIVTVSNAVLQPRRTNHQFRQLATQTMEFGTYSTDGATNPVAVAAA